MIRETIRPTLSGWLVVPVLLVAEAVLTLEQAAARVTR